MTPGHPHSYDDAILESGNRKAKSGKRILFWGGTEELDEKGEKHADGRAKRRKHKQFRPTGKRDSDGNPLYTTVMKEANPSVEAQHLENTLLDQRFQLARGSNAKSQKVQI